MVFVDGTRESIEGAILVIEEFAKWSDLRISLEKSRVYMAGISEDECRTILSNFPFAKGDLPVRYLGLPLLTQSMRKQDYLPLLETNQARINT